MIIIIIVISISFFKLITSFSCLDLKKKKMTHLTTICRGVIMEKISNL